PEGRAARFLRGAAGTLAILGLLVAVAGVVVAPASGILTHPLRIPRSDFDVEQFSPLIFPLIAMVVFLVALGGWDWFRHSPRPAILMLALLPVSLVVVGASGFNTVFESRSGRELAARIGPISPDTELVFYRCFPAGLPFYLRRTGSLITADGSELTSNYVEYALRKNSSWPTGVVPIDRSPQWLRERRGPVFVIANESGRVWLDGLANVHGATVDKLSGRYYGALLPASAKSPSQQLFGARLKTP
ncbi:MAG TPA: hypothetical protein PLX89_23800, partial [Verrucomicrobiota bacterium]|nr:hypothetical protein [Verrucomicrobiota bacterium]